MGPIRRLGRRALTFALGYLLLSFFSHSTANMMVMALLVFSFFTELRPNR
jgi:hypothetical protein